MNNEVKDRMLANREFNAKCTKQHKKQKKDKLKITGIKIAKK